MIHFWWLRLILRSKVRLIYGILRVLVVISWVMTALDWWSAACSGSFRLVVVGNARGWCWASVRLDFAGKMSGRVLGGLELVGGFFLYERT